MTVNGYPPQVNNLKFIMKFSVSLMDKKRALYYQLHLFFSMNLVEVLRYPLKEIPLLQPVVLVA